MSARGRLLVALVLGVSAAAQAQPTGTSSTAEAGGAVDLDAGVGDRAPDDAGERGDAGTSSVAEARDAAAWPDATSALAQLQQALRPTSTITPTIVVPPPALPGTSAVPVPTGRGLDEDTRALWRLAQGLVPVLRGESLGSGWLLSVAALVLLAASVGLGRARRALPRRGLVPRVLRWMQAACGAALIVLVLALVPRLLPAALTPLVPWVLVAAAVSLGWSARELLGDAIAGFVLLAEGRLGHGTWIRWEGHHGQIQRRSARALWLRDPTGRTVVVPYRRILGSAIVLEEAPEVRHELSLRLDLPCTAAELRRALTDAVLSSPWVRARVRPTVRRDELDPTLWHVSVSLVDGSARVELARDLVERVESVLASGGVPGDSWSTNHGGPPGDA